MDKALYVAMTGARASLQAQGTVSHNLANVDTKGFKAALAGTEAFRIQGQGFPSRVDAVLIDPGFDGRTGSQMVTGRSLDISLQPNRWMAVQAADGGTAYTRNGELSVTPRYWTTTAPRSRCRRRSPSMSAPTARCRSSRRAKARRRWPWSVACASWKRHSRSWHAPATA